MNGARILQVLGAWVIVLTVAVYAFLEWRYEIAPRWECTFNHIAGSFTVREPDLYDDMVRAYREDRLFMFHRERIQLCKKL